MLFILKNISEIRYNLNIGNFWILNCIFTILNSFNGNGGAILLTQDNSNLLVELCSFNMCTVSLNGGAIYFYCNINGGCSIKKTCGSNCYTANSKSFQFGGIKGSQNINNLVDYLSINKCPSTGTTNYRSFSFLGMNNTFLNSNSSYHSLYQVSGVYINNSNYFLGKYLTFCHSIHSDSVVVLLHFSNILYEFHFTNIINITQSTRLGIIHSRDAKVLFKNSIFNFKLNPLFSTYLNGIVYIYDCWSNSFSFLQYESKGTIYFSNKQSFTQTFKLFNYQTFNCIVENPLVNNFTKKKKNLIFSFIILKNHFYIFLLFQLIH